MPGKEMSERKPVTMIEACDILEERKKESELGYEQKLAYEHTKKFARLKSKEAMEMRKEIVEAGMSEATATKIVDIMPVDVIQLKQVLIMGKEQVEEDKVNELIKIVEKYKGK